MSEVVVKNNHLKFNGVNYFRGHAEEVSIMAYGDKKAPLTGANRLEVKDKILVPQIAAEQVTRVQIDFSRTSRTAFNRKVSAVVYGATIETDGNVVFEQLKSGQLELVKFSVPINRVIEAANSSPTAIQDLIRYGQGARIAHQVFVVMSATLATQFSNSGAVDISVTYDDIEVTAGFEHKSTGQTTVTLSPGTTFAYLLTKIKWDARRKKKKTRIVDLRTDQWGPS